MSALDTTPTIPASRAFWTTAELAERFGVDTDTIYELAATGGLPHVRFGRAYRFPIGRVLEWEQQREITNEGSAANRPQPRPARPRAAGSARTKSNTRVCISAPHDRVGTEKRPTFLL